ncbi:hypothetical protein JTE90_025493 [Oedothorax gibbosus]|uniref:Uncharacterized protein n=1 Tax=Oedothorax gibbosus TaxID=931172 RepID=A0AAV6V0K8_9ARAC|nr:hypothetical protein JTE90_025493 [Oedothorax gibbosus]
MYNGGKKTTHVKLYFYSFSITTKKKAFSSAPVIAETIELETNDLVAHHPKTRGTQRSVIQPDEIHGYCTFCCLKFKYGHPFAVDVSKEKQMNYDCCVTVTIRPEGIRDLLGF